MMELKYKDGTSIRKIKVHWEPRLDQDIEALCSPNSPFYDSEVANELEEKYQEHLKEIKKLSDVMEAYSKVRNKFLK